MAQQAGQAVYQRDVQMSIKIHKSNGMNFHLDLAPGWCLRADRLQWLLCRKRHRDDKTIWQPVGFIASDKRMLARILAKEGLFNSQELNPAVHAFLAAPPSHFREWRGLVSDNSGLEALIFENGN